MKTIKAIIIASLGLFGINSALATQTAPQCPSVSAIQQLGVTDARYVDYMFGYKAGQENRYNTTTDWLFNIYIPVFDANSAEEASKDAQTALKEGLVSVGPATPGLGGSWMCTYHFVGGEPYSATAMSLTSK